jgi:diguanylate cyclase (GGDEF)-like protein
VRGRRPSLSHLLRVVADQLDDHSGLRDPLTGLPNRRSLKATIEHSIDGASSFALLLIDLDRFKQLNDTLGHAVGDALLQELAPRLVAAAGDADIAARLGGDEFAVLLSDPGQAREIADRLKAALERPLSYRGLQLLVEANVGIALYPSHALDARGLLRCADLAAQAARRMRVGVGVYDPGETNYPRDRIALLEELPAAIERQELIVEYQPKFDLTSDRLLGVEALVRWLHPVRGLLYPLSFLPVVEQTDLMRPLTLSVLEQALAQTAAWREDGLEIPVAVNLSAPNLLDVGLPGDIDALLDRFGLEPACLELEVTERIMETDPARIAETLTEISSRGVTLALDDFGTGASSLSHVRDLPVQVLKIDKSFVRGTAKGDPRDAALVRAVIGLARDLGMQSVAEGIETAEDRDRMAAWGCDQGQGFWLARPLAGEAVSELARNRAIR